MINTQRLFLVIAILPAYTFAMEAEIAQGEPDSSIAIPSIIKTIQLPDGSTKEFHSNGMIEQFSPNKTIIERHYPHHEAKIKLERWELHPTTAYSRANDPSYVLSDLHMQITKTAMRLTPHDAEYISGYHDLSIGYAFGTFIRDNQTIKTIVNSDGSFIEDSKTFRKIVFNIQKKDYYDETSRRMLQNFKQMKLIDKTNNEPKYYSMLASDYTPNNPIVEFMQTYDTKKYDNTLPKNESSTSSEIQDITGTFSSLKLAGLILFEASQFKPQA